MLGALVLLAIPILVDLIVTGKRRLFSYFAADAFYYLVVARNWARHGVISFDGTHPTNGFHPLWQVLLTGMYRVSLWLGLGQTAILWVDLLVGLALACVAIVVLGRVIQAAHGRLTPWFAILPVGVYALLFIPFWLTIGGVSAKDPFEGTLPLYGTLWSYVNGMETPVVLTCFAVVALLVVTRRVEGARPGLVLGVALGLLTLARLDTGFVAVAFLGAFALRAAVRRDRETVRFAAGAAATFVALVVAYLVWNRVYAGVFLPVSGSLKSTFPRPSLQNLRDLRSLATGHHLFARERMYRQAPVIIPSLFALGYLVVVGRAGRLGRLFTTPVERAHDRYRLVLAATAAGVLALSTYNYLFVPGYNQGHWYYPVSTLFVSLVALEMLRNVTWASVRPVATGLAVAAVSIVVFVTLGRTSDYHAQYADFYFVGAPRERAFYAPQHPKMLSVDDGIDAFATGFPTMSGTGFALDPEAARAKEHDDLLALALRRGDRRITSLVYLDTNGFDTRTPSDVIRHRLGGLGFGRAELYRHRYRIEYVGTHPRFVVVRVLPLTGAGAAAPAPAH